MKKEIIDVASTELPVNETLRIQKCRLMPADGNENEMKRFSITTGIHGDELEGQYAAWQLIQRIEQEPDSLHGIVDIYPGMNPMGIDTMIRGLPDFDLDMNRIFPGYENGDMYEYIANQMIRDLMGSDLVTDIHASNIFLTEVPQIRINELHEKTLLPYAANMNMDLIWIHGNATVLESTLAYSLNSRNVPTLVVEMGVGMRITKAYGDQLVNGFLSTMKKMGMWTGTTSKVKMPRISHKIEQVTFLNAPCSGVFIKQKDAGSIVKKHDVIGQLIDPLTGEIKAEVKADEDGWLFTIREYPMVQEGSLMGRILKEAV